MMVTGESTFPPLVTSAVRELSAQRGSSLAYRLGTRVVPILVLCAIIAWAAVQLMDTAGGATPKEGRALALTADDDPEDAERTFAGLDVSGLLDLRVLALADDVDVSTIEDFGATAVKGGSVSIVNLWATWCGPCKAELPGLQRALANAGPTARFVPMLVDNTASIEEARLAYKELGGPQAAAFIADAGLGGGVRQQLVDLELLADGADIDLPTTLILDCHRRLRWHHTGVLKEADLTELGRVVGELQDELGTPTCEPLRSKRKMKRRGKKPDNESRAEDSAEPGGATSDAAIEEAPMADGERSDRRPRSLCDQDGVCDAKRGETDINCPSDCKTVM